MIRKGYSDGPSGQIHWRMLVPEAAGSQPDLYCLQPAPFSGLAWTGIMPHLAKGRRVIAPDFPGYGGSDGAKPDPSIAEYAQAMLAVVTDLSGDREVDLAGFHTGTLVSAEMSLTARHHVRRLALVDIPAFDSETSAKYLDSAARPLEITENLTCLEKPWKVLTSRLESQSTDRAFEMFVEQLRPGKLMNSAFHAAFTYDARARMPDITHPALVLATQSGLLEPTRWAGQNIPSAIVVERLDITRAVLDEAAELTASEILNFLDEAQP
ncbi:Pimeloyl-ACP methyl ester carboxylesterase [Parasphingorhabdus marina DSM 22363]|uniref:Pimeloyl-ACP methyl ester carboxylesterase n=1 Tax=Parasphingorhabdus marina DSM 22363 TaxID=1123272 RepID=A0A1N6CMG7_9SPHN|nr:alpha/beta hydrolase [Parasphingorhabdus marina]SIN59743.1 Pimeloyl-ACP methyl ester carboxylesterase [Parasphingorhabdus marina DSM 22363]